MRQSSIDRELTMELIVGTFMFMILLALGYFTIVLGGSSLFEKKYPFQVEFTDALGLRKDDSVVLRGMTIGKIKSLTLVREKVRVLAMLDSPVRLRKDYKITIISTSILGGRLMQIEAGSKDAELLSADIMPQGDKPYDLMAEAAAVVHDVRVALSEGGILTNLESAVAAVRNVTAKIDNGQGTIGRLINDDTVYNDLRGVMTNVSDIAVELKGVAQRLSRGEGTLGKLLNDDSVYKELQIVMTNLAVVSDRLAAGQGTLGKLMSPDDTVYRDLAAAAASISNITAKIDRGEGLLGKLVNDDKLYKQAQDALSEVKQAVEDFRETSPVVSFASLLFGAF